MISKVDRGDAAQLDGPARATVLVIDDEPQFHETVARHIVGYRRLTAMNGWQAMQMLAKHHVDVVLLDLSLPDTTGLKLLEEIRGERQDLEVIVITSHHELPNAVACVKAGAFDFLAKAYENYERINEHIERALEHRRRARAEIVQGADDVLREGLAQIDASGSKELQEITRLLRQVGPTPLTVLLEGESGVGKELLARYVHLHSNRAASSFVPVNLAAIPSNLIESALFGHEKGAFTGADRQRIGKFELADRGTIFLDEIGELDGTFQTKLLRVLQEKEVDRIGGAEPAPVDVRVIAATNKDLEAEVIAGRFREDLWFRLNVVRVKVPPLRSRREDIPQLLDVLAARHARAMSREAPSFTKEVVRILSVYPWPGNVRELENLVMRLVALHPGQSVRVDHIPVEYCLEHLSNLAAFYADRHAAPTGLYNMAVGQFERYFVRHMVDRCKGNKAETARVLGVSLSTIKNKMTGEDE